MNNTKEYNEIIRIFKQLISDSEIQITPESFSIAALKNIILTNPKFQEEWSSLKEKSKSWNEKNTNILSIIKQWNKNKFKDNKVILSSIAGLSVLHNEPEYIVNLNNTIYDFIIADIESKKAHFHLYSTIQNNFLEEWYALKNEFYSNDNFRHINMNQILSLIYSASNPNIKDKNTQNKFKFKLNTITFKSWREMFCTLIHNWWNTTIEQLNSKSKKDNFLKLIHDSKRIQLLELCKAGIPHSFRKNIYSILLGTEGLQYNNSILDNTKNICIFDYYLLKDINNISSSGNYFWFEENWIQLLTCWIRDSDCVHQIQGIRPIWTISSSKDSTTKIPIPQSGIFPFQGLAFQLAPFTYMSNAISDYYWVSKFFYTKYWSHLNSFTSQRKSILTLLCSFSSIYNELIILSAVKKHFDKIGYDIYQELMNWFGTSFAELWTPESLFWWYDIIILTENWDVFVLFAWGIINYKKEELITLSTHKDVKKCFDEIIFDEVNSLEIMMNLFNDASG